MSAADRLGAARTARPRKQSEDQEHDDATGIQSRSVLAPGCAPAGGPARPAARRELAAVLQASGAAIADPRVEDGVQQVGDRLASTTTTAKTRTMPSTTGKSRLVIACSELRPTPGSAKIGSMITVPPIERAEVQPDDVIRPNSELRNACREQDLPGPDALGAGGRDVVLAAASARRCRRAGAGCRSRTAGSRSPTDGRISELQVVHGARADSGT